jgi:hypothetical protein
MKKILFLVLVFMLISIVACKKAVEKETTGAMEEKGEAMTKTTETPKVEKTGDKAVDAVGNNLNDVNSVEKDLSTDELSDLDSGLSDVQNI